MRISISFLGFSTAEELATAMESALGQNLSAEPELLICDPEGALDRGQLEELCRKHPAVICGEASDPLGLLQATGDHIAICQAGYRWTDSGKLARQLAVLEADPACSLVFHDVELLKENGYPVDQSVRNRFIRELSYEDRTYGITQLLRFSNCGFMGTWLLRNIFRGEKERGLYKTAGLEPVLRAKALLIANGHATNLFDDRMVSWQAEETVYSKARNPRYDADTVQALLGELACLQALLKDHYGLETDDRYRLLSIANGSFNYLEANAATEASVQEFMDIFRKAIRPEYLDKEALRTSEISFYLYLCKKIRMYLTKKGTDAAAPLVSFLERVTDAEWSYSIRACKNPAVKAAMLEKLTASRPDAKAYIAAERIKKNPSAVFASKVWRKCKKVFNRVKRLGRSLVLRYMRKKGYSSYMSQEWYDTVRNNLLNDKETPLKTKLWCYRRGFMPWRIPQYGLTEENFREYPSDRDYMYLHQINNSYKKWIEDKMTFRLVLDPFKQHLPKYYFQIIQRDDRQLILKLNDCPEGYEATFDEMLRLLREKGKLALKAASGTHGVGFYKMHYEDGRYYLNNKETTEFGIRETIKSFKSFYIVTEYINMHDDIKNIFAGSVNTIRVMMINRDGHHPQLMDAYMRIGTEKSGVTDNVAYGGVVCSVDLETGEFSNGLQLVNHVYMSIENHPDTGAPLHGVIPNWDIIRKGLVEISQYLGQLEYLGFDVVCTPEGFVLLETNAHQDLHRLPAYDQRVRDFFFYKLRRKERYNKVKRKIR